MYFLVCFLVLASFESIILKFSSNMIGQTCYSPKHFYELWQLYYHQSGRFVYFVFALTTLIMNDFYFVRSGLIIAVENENINLMEMLLEEGIMEKDALLVSIRLSKIYVAVPPLYRILEFMDFIII